MWEWSGYCTFVGAPGRKYIEWSQQTRKKSCCDSCFMDLTWLFKRFDKVAQHISRPLQNKTKLRFDQDFRACWSFCFQLKALSQSSHCLGTLWQYFHLSNWLQQKHSTFDDMKLVKMHHSQHLIIYDKCADLHWGWVGSNQWKELVFTLLHAWSKSIQSHLFSIQGPVV